MNYVNLLSLICESDRKTTSEFRKLYNLPIAEFIDEKEILGEGQLSKPLKDNEYLIFSNNNDNVSLEYYRDATGKSIKTCTKKIQLTFYCDSLDRCRSLLPNEPTFFLDSFYKQIIVKANVYNLTRDQINFNQVNEKLDYTINYYLRVTQNDEYFLESQIVREKSSIKNRPANIEKIKLLILNKISKKYQSKLNNYTDNELEV